MVASLSWPVRSESPCGRSRHGEKLKTQVGQSVEQTMQRGLVTNGSCQDRFALLGPPDAQTSQPVRPVHVDMAFDVNLHLLHHVASIRLAPSLDLKYQRSGQDVNRAKDLAAGLFWNEETRPWRSSLRRSG